MKKLFLPAVALGMFLSCRREVVPDGKADMTEARAVVNMNPLAGTPFSYPVQMDVVSTLAGGNLAGYRDGTREQAMFNGLSDVATDAQGNVYIADGANNRIRKMNANGEVTTYAGDGQYGWKDGSALSAEFRYPAGVAVDARGIVYVADQNNNRIRKITPDGTVSTVAGGDAAGFADGPGDVAKFNAPADVAVDASGVLYVADFGNNRIRRISTAGVVTQWCGSTAGFNDAAGTYAKFNGPVSIAVAPSGVVYVADYRNHRIRKIYSGTVTTLAGSGEAGFADGAGDAAKFDLPMGAATDAAGNVYVTDNQSRVRKVTPAGVVTTLAGSPVASFRDGYEFTAQLDDPRGLVVDIYGMIYIADRGNNRIRRMVNVPAVRTLNTIKIKDINGLDMDGAGNLYTSGDSGRIYKITPAGATSLVAGGGYGYADGVGAAAKFGLVGSLAVDGAGNIIIPDFSNNRIRKITPAGVVTTIAGNDSYQDVDGTGANASFNSPNGVALDPSGNIYVAEFYGAIRKVTPAGVVTTLTVIPTIYTGPGDDRQAHPPACADIRYADNGLTVCIPGQNAVWNYDLPSGSGGIYGGTDQFAYFFPEGFAWGPENWHYFGTGVFIMKKSDWGATSANDFYAGGYPSGYADAPNEQARFNSVQELVRNPATHVLYAVDGGNGRIRMLSE